MITMQKETYRTEFERIVREGLERAGRSKEWLADKLEVTTQTLENYFRGGEVKPATRHFIGTLLDIPEFISSEPVDVSGK